MIEWLTAHGPHSNGAVLLIFACFAAVMIWNKRLWRRFVKLRKQHDQLGIYYDALVASRLTNEQKRLSAEVHLFHAEEQNKLMRAELVRLYYAAGEDIPEVLVVDEKYELH